MRTCLSLSNSLPQYLGFAVSAQGVIQLGAFFISNSTFLLFTLCAKKQLSTQGVVIQLAPLSLEELSEACGALIAKLHSMQSMENDKTNLNLDFGLKSKYFF